MTPEEHYTAAQSRLARAIQADRDLTRRDKPIHPSEMREAFARHLAISDAHRRMAETGRAFVSDISTDPGAEPVEAPGDPLPRRYSSDAMPTWVEELPAAKDGAQTVWMVHVKHPRWGIPFMYVQSVRVRPIFHAVKFTQGDQEGIELRTLEGRKLTERVWPL